MNNNWHNVKQILNSALSLDPGERELYLDAACAGDAGLRQEVEDLIGSYRSEFLEEPLVADMDEGEDSVKGSILGRYEIIQLIGLGGMGKVYLARDNQLGRKVAIKVLNQKYEEHETSILRFIQEAKAASALNHPNILTIHDIGESEIGHFIVMELVAGRPLSAIIATDHSVETLLSLGSQMAKALCAAHAAGITHRDIKPDNIIVRDDGYLKIVDFGLARLVPLTATDGEAALVRQTSPGVVLGTVAYMSPEQSRGESVGPPTDIFALGIVFYELIAGQHPFKAASPLGMLQLINSQTPVPPSSMTNAIPAPVDELILRMLAKQPRLRPTAREVDQALSGLGDTLGSLPLRQPDRRTSIARHTVGRQKEREELRAAFRAARAGRGSFLCVTGEPGIGKTTLVEDFVGDLAAEGQYTIARGRCSERLAGTEAYLPLLEALESLLRVGDRAARVLAMKQIAPTWYAQVAPQGADSEETAQLRAEVKTASQARMKRELGNFLLESARRHPLVLFFDDLHWADGSTIDLLNFLAGKFDAINMLIVATYRPSDMLLAKHPFLQIKPELQARGVCRELLLDFLQEAEVAEYLELEFPGHQFPAEFPKLIHEKTEGSPLFMADLVRYLRDRGVIAHTSGSWILAQTLPDIERELPESVRGMIERKIAQLTEEDRKLLTAASVQGYEFDSAVVAQALNLEADEVEERLERLERIFSFVKLVNEAEFPDRTLTLKYRFVHALYQHSLYAGLRVTRKTTLSAAVAQALEDFHGKQGTNVANGLAILWETAREYARAADYFLKAANNATQINAHREAIQLASRGIRALQKLPEPTKCAPLELGLQLRLGFSLTTVDGWTSREAEQAFTRAYMLCQQAENEPRLFAALRGIWARHLIRGEYQIARPLSEQLLQLAEQANDPVLLGSACFGLGVTMCWQGEFAIAHAYCERALDLYDPAHCKAYLAFSTQDMAVQAKYILAFCLWNLGFPDRALKKAQEALALAEQLSHPHSLGAALHGLGLVYFWRGEWDANQRQLERAAALAQENDLGDFVIWATLEHDLAQGFEVRSDAAVNQVRRSLEAVRVKGLGMTLTSWLTNVAELYGMVDQIAAGLDLIAEALVQIEPTGERFWEAEVWRVRGDLLLQENDSQGEAETCYHKAIEIARAQSAKSLELRATMSLARLRRRQEKYAESRQMIEEIYGWFTEGFGTADLKEAKALLSE